MCLRRAAAILVMLGLSLATPRGGAADALFPPPTADGSPHQPAILLLAVEDPTQPAVRRLTDGFRDAVLADPNPPGLYIEFLDTTRFVDPEYIEGFRRWLRDKYRNRPVDLVVAIGENALYFLADERGDPWRDVPVLFLEAGELTYDIHARLPHVTGVLLENHFQAQLAVIKRVLPDTERVVLIYGASEVERMRFGGFAEDVRTANLGLEPIEWAGWAIEDIVAQVARLPERTVVFYANPQSDTTGRVFTVRWSCELITAAANRPSFSMPVDHVGWGVVGGLVRDFEVVGHAFAGHALDRLRNLSSSDETITIPIASYTTLLFDARQLERWRIPESRLPPGSTVRFREPNLWRDYRPIVLSAMAVATVQTMLLVGLLFERRRRQSAEVQARRHLAGMAHLERRAALGQLTATLAHELKQPLTAILRNAEAGSMLLAAGSLRTDDEIKEIFKDIRADDARANEVIDRLRGLLQKRELAMQPVDVNDMVRETVGLLAPDAAARDMRMDVELASPPATVTGDRVHLQQVLLNLVLNGMEAMAETPSERRRLLVRTSSNNGQIDVLVKDTGAGIPADAAANIFEPFFTTKTDGMGMGLSISRSIVEAHGGRIVAENNTEGGATVGFSVPLRHVD
jgi:signal transduction histidine kinase